MTKERKIEILVYLENEIRRAKENAEKADEASKFIVTGPSQSGDKYHAQNAAVLAGTYAGRLEKLKKEITDSDENRRVEALPVCFIETEFNDGNKLQFYLVNNAVSLTRYLFISKDSPLGASVLGKKAGEAFIYSSEANGNNKVYSGKILKIE